MEPVQALQACLLFRSLPEATITRELLPRGRTREFARGKFLIQPQDQVNELGVVLEGRVQLLHLFDNGSVTLVDVLQPPELMGADLICTRTRLSPYHAVAETPARIFFLQADLLLQAGTLPEDCRQEVLHQLLTLISQENMKKEYRLAILSQRGLRDRIMTYLTMQANKRGSRTLAIPMSREKMADFLCVNRSALSHELSLMQQEGLLQFEKNIFTLPHWEPPQGSAAKGEGK